MKKGCNGLILGIILVLLGIILGLNALEITNINIFFNGWWTLFIIIPSLIGLIKNEEKLDSFIWLLIGLLLLLIVNDVISMDLVWKLSIPVVLLLIGLSIIYKSFTRNKNLKEIKKIVSKDQEMTYYTATFSKNLVKVDDEFINSEINAVFGEVVIDLSGAKIKEDIIINSTTVFGGIRLIVPKDVIVKTTSTSIFGGTNNKAIDSENKNAKIIYVNATNVFGGADIK